MQKQKHNVLSTLTDMARFYGTDLDERQLELYVEVMSQADPEEFYRAARAYMADPGNSKFPMPPHSILAKLGGGDETLAKEAAARAIRAVADFGYSNPMLARNFVGELGWEGIRAFGGWSYFCENLGRGISVTQAMAQIREIAKAKLELGRKGLLNLPPALPGAPSSPQLSAPQSSANWNPAELVEMKTVTSGEK